MTGDPRHAELTQIAQALGWKGSGGRFDLPPLIVQMPGEEPQLFELPPKEVLEVPLTHPDLGCRATPADWAWVVPPMSGSTAPTFHRAYSPDPELSPNFHYQSPAWKASGELHSNDACPVAH